MGKKKVQASVRIYKAVFRDGSGVVSLPAADPEAALVAIEEMLLNLPDLKQGQRAALYNRWLADGRRFWVNGDPKPVRASRAILRHAIWCDCSGEAHQGGSQADHCAVCMPYWGRHPRCPGCDGVVLGPAARGLTQPGRRGFYCKHCRIYLKA